MKRIHKLGCCPRSPGQQALLVGLDSGGALGEALLVREELVLHDRRDHVREEHDGVEDHEHHRNEEDGHGVHVGAADKREGEKHGRAHQQADGNSISLDGRVELLQLSVLLGRGGVGRQGLAGGSHRFRVLSKSNRIYQRAIYYIITYLQKSQYTVHW